MRIAQADSGLTCKIIEASALLVEGSLSQLAASTRSQKDYQMHIHALPVMAISKIPASSNSLGQYQQALLACFQCAFMPCHRVVSACPVHHLLSRLEQVKYRYPTCLLTRIIVPFMTGAFPWNLQLQELALAFAFKKVTHYHHI